MNTKKPEDPRPTTEGAARLKEPAALTRIALEQLLTGLWSEILGIDEIDTHDDFFLLGGNSLMAMQVISRLRRAIGIEVPLIVFFDSPTVAGLAVATIESLIDATETVKISGLLGEPEATAD